MKKVLSLASIAAVFLLGCSADGFFSGQIADESQPEKSVQWSQACQISDGTCNNAKSKDECDIANGKLVKISACK